MRLCLRMLLFLLLCPTGFAAEAPRDPLDGFEGFVSGVLKDWNVPGLAIGIVQSNKTIYAKGFGYRDLKKQMPVTTNTLFAIGSTTKAFTCFVLGTLVDEGKLDWDKPVRNYIPEFHLKDLHATELTTARDLVTHRTGLPRHDLVWYNNTTISRLEVVQRLAYLEPSHAFREKYQYNNLMYVVAGQLIERITGQNWEHNVRQRIFTPLGIKNSNFSVRDSQKTEDFALPYHEEKDEVKPIAFRNIDIVGPAGSINSSIHEMLPWLMLNLNKGKHGDRAIINASTLAEIHSPQMTMGATFERADSSQPVYCLGWSIMTQRGRRVLAHGGGIDGFITQVALLPDQGLGIVVFGNLDGTSACSVVSTEAVSRILNEPRAEPYAEALAKRKKAKESDKEAGANKDVTRKSGTKPSRPLSEYAGEFEHPGYGVLKVALKEEKLEARFNDMTAPLEHWHYDVFNSSEGLTDRILENHRFNFLTDVDGNIATLAVNFEPAVDPIQFKRQIDSRLLDTNYLVRFVGKFELSGHTLTVSLGGMGLILTITGEPTHQLVPKLDGSFAVKDHTNFVLKFVTQGDDDHATAVQVQRPSGVVLAPRKT